MTMFTNGFSTLQMPEDFEPIDAKDEFTELYLVNTKIPMSIKFSTTPTLVGLPDIKAGIERNVTEFTYPYADRDLDDFYLNIIRSLKIIVPKYVVENGEYRINNEEK